MSAVHVSEDHLIDLARGLLPQDDRQRVLGHVETCAECEHRFRDICRANAALALREPPSLVAPRRRRWLPAAAAVLLIGLFAARFLIDRSGSDDPDAWLPVDAERVMLRSLPDSEDNARFLRAVEAYADHDAPRVLALLGDREIPPQYDFVRLLLASALVREARYAKALAVLDALDVGSLPQPYRDRARWERFLALDRSGSTDEARAILSDLASRPGELAERARRALRRAPAGRKE